MRFVFYVTCETVVTHVTVDSSGQVWYALLQFDRDAGLVQQSTPLQCPDPFQRSVLSVMLCHQETSGLRPKHGLLLSSGWLWCGQCPVGVLCVFTHVPPPLMICGDNMEILLTLLYDGVTFNDHYMLIVRL